MLCLSKKAADAADAAADAATNSRTTTAMGSRSAPRRGNRGFATLFDGGRARLPNGRVILARVAEGTKEGCESCEGSEGPSKVNVDTICFRVCGDVRVKI